MYTSKIVVIIIIMKISSPFTECMTANVGHKKKRTTFLYP